MIAGKNEITEYIPQRPPMVMIDSLLHADTMRTVSGLTVNRENLFFENGALSESGLVENIAQTAAAGVGYVCKTENRKVPVGFIASIKDLVIYNLPAEGDVLQTEVVITNTVMEVSIVRGEVRSGETLLASCEMRIFIKPENN